MAGEGERGVRGGVRELRDELRHGPGLRLLRDRRGGPGGIVREVREESVIETQKQTPEDNGVVESFHAGLERDYLRTLVFDSFAEAEAYLAWAREDYNTIKPKQRLRWMTPSEYHEEVSVSAK